MDPMGNENSDLVINPGAFATQMAEDADLDDHAIRARTARAIQPQLHKGWLKNGDNRNQTILERQLWLRSDVVSTYIILHNMSKTKLYI